MILMMIMKSLIVVIIMMTVILMIEVLNQAVLWKGVVMTMLLMV